MKTSEIMTSRVITVTPATSIAEGARLMLQHRISGLPVVGPKGEVVGIVTEGTSCAGRRRARRHAIRAGSNSCWEEAGLPMNIRERMRAESARS
jgi:CBS-domain-containing membrane protein